MLQTPETFIPALTPQSPTDALHFVFRGDELLLREADLALPDGHALAWLALPRDARHPVGLLQGRYCDCAWLPADHEPLPGFIFRKLRSLFGVLDDDHLAVAGRASQIANWARTHRFCGACGSPTEHMAGERSMRCPSCGHQAYPRISPAMMVLVRRDHHILLARHTHSPAPFFTALAGFLEAGESVEEAVHREVFEEVGLKVRDLRYFGSQPWPFPHSLMVAFTAEYADGDIQIDEAEIAEARWFGPGDPVPKIPIGLSIASHLIRAHLPDSPGAA